MARAIWSGVVGFGLVSIPVKLESAVRDRQLRFHRLSPDGKCRLRMKLFCPETGEEYEFGEAARGYEVGPDQYVLVSDEELAELRPTENRTIEILDFVDLSEIDPIYFDRPYHLVPDKNGAKPYRLLAEAMERSRRVAIARFAMRSRGYLAVIRPVAGRLLLETMRYRDEVLLPEEVEASRVDDVEVSPRELAMAEQLIESMRVPFDPAAYRDEYREQLKAILDAKAEGQVVTAPSGPERARGEVVDLMDALKKSLGQAKGGARAEAEAQRAAKSQARAKPGPKKVAPEKKAKGAPRKRASGRG